MYYLIVSYPPEMKVKVGVKWDVLTLIPASSIISDERVNSIFFSSLRPSGQNLIPTVAITACR
jgi:hypothetical protein